MAYISNTSKFGPLPKVSPAWKSFGSQYRIAPNNTIQPKNGGGYSYSPTTSLLTGKKIAPALFTPTKTASPSPAPAQTAPTNSISRNPVPQTANSTIPITSTATSGSTPTTTQNSTKTRKGLLTPPPKGTFGSFVSGLYDASKASNDQKKFLRAVSEASQAGKQAAEDARGITSKYGSEIAEIGRIGAGAVAGNKSTGSNVVGSGNANLAAESASNRIAALGTAMQGELQGVDKALTATDQAITGSTNALSGANTVQQLQQSALSSGATYSQPSPAGYGQTVFDPLTGGYTGGGNLEPNAVAADLARKVQSGELTYEQAVSSMGYAGGAGQQFLNQALGQGFNAPLSSATIGGQAQVYGQLPGMEAAERAAGGIKDKIITYLNTNPKLNASDLAVGNKLQQWIEGKQLTDPKYQTLFNYLNEYTNTMAPILGVGGDPTNFKTEIAQNFVNAAASGQSIAEVLENMQVLSRDKITQLRQGAMSGGAQMGGGTWDW